MEVSKETDRKENTKEYGKQNKINKVEIDRLIDRQNKHIEILLGKETKIISSDTLAIRGSEKVERNIVNKLKKMLENFLFITF